MYLQSTEWSVIYNEICNKKQVLEIIVFQLYFKYWNHGKTRLCICENIFFATIPYISLNGGGKKEGSSPHQPHHIKNLIQIWIADWQHRRWLLNLPKAQILFQGRRSYHFTKLKSTTACCQNFFQLIFYIFQYIVWEGRKEKVCYILWSLPNTSRLRLSFNCSIFSSFSHGSDMMIIKD